MSVPSLNKWNMYGGGTFAAEGKHAYDIYVEPGQLSGGVRQYTISPISYPDGKHKGYHLSVAGSGEGGLHKDLGMFRSPGQAVTRAKSHYNQTTRMANPPSLERWLPAAAVKFNRDGSVSIKKNPSKWPSRIKKARVGVKMGYTTPKLSHHVSSWLHRRDKRFSKPRLAGPKSRLPNKGGRKGNPKPTLSKIWVLLFDGQAFTAPTTKTEAMRAKAGLLRAGYNSKKLKVVRVR